MHSKSLVIRQLMRAKLDNQEAGKHTALFHRIFPKRRNITRSRSRNQTLHYLTWKNHQSHQSLLMTTNQASGGTMRSQEGAGIESLRIWTTHLEENRA